MTKKQVGEEKVYSAFISSLLYITKGSQDRNLEAAADAEALQGCCLLLAHHGLLSLLSYRTHDHQPRDGTTQHRLGPPPSITNFKRCSTTGFYGGIFSTEAPSLVMTVACDKLT